MDSLYNHQWAQAFARGETFVTGPYFRPPLYPQFLGIIYRLFGADPWAPRIIQAVLGSLNCGLLFVIGRTAFNRRVGIIAGFAGAFYWSFAYFDAELLSPVLIVFFTLLLVVGLLRASSRGGRALLWLTNGIVLGLSAITRPDILILAPAILAWIVVLCRPVWRRTATYALCFVAGCMVPILPVTIRNYAVGRDLVMITANGGVNFYIGNNPGADGMSASIPGDPVELKAGYEAQVARAERAEGRPLKASEVSSYYTRATWRYVQSSPNQAYGRILKKLVYFWTRYEVPNDQDIYFVTQQYVPITKFMPIGFWLIGPLGILGMALSFRRARTLFPLWGIVCAYVIVDAVFFVNARFRIAAVALLMVLAGYALHWTYRALRDKQSKGLLFAASLLICGSLLVERVPPGGDRMHVQAYSYAGNALANQGKYKEAERMLTESLVRGRDSKWPLSPNVLFSLGYVRFQQQNYNGARPCFEEALNLDPSFTASRWYLAQTLERLGDLNKAIEVLRQLVLQVPDNAEYQLALGKLLVRLGRVNEALPIYARALELNRANSRALADVARLLIRDGRYGDAASLLRTGLVYAPNDPELDALWRQSLQRPVPVKQR